MADFETLYPGRFLRKEALPAPKVIRIMDIKTATLEGEKGAEQKVILSYRAADGEGEIVWCRTNALLTAAALDERDYAKWIGRLITICNNPQVDLGGKKVGGIRVYGSPEMTRDRIAVEVKRPRRKRGDSYVLIRTDKMGRDAQGASPSVPTAEIVDAPPVLDGIAPEPIAQELS